MAVNISNTKSNTLLSGTSGNDTIENGEGAYNVTINAGAGNDSVSNSGNNVTINAGAGNDSVANYSSNVTINAGAGNDSVSNYGDAVTNISGGGGSDTIFSLGNVSTIIGDNGDDYIYISNPNADSDSAGNLNVEEVVSDVSVSGGSGSDTIQVEGCFIDEDIEEYRVYLPNTDFSISGGLGDDLVKLSNSERISIQYASGDGNDTVIGFNSTDTLQITEGSYTTTKSGKNLIVKVGDGSITLKNVSTANISGKSDNLPTGLSYNSDKTKITASKKFTQKSFSFAKYPEVQFFDGQKITYNVKITGNSLDNTIEGGKKTDTIYGGAGDDRVFGNGGNDKLYGGAGNDTLYGGGGDDTLTGGKGNDVFSYSSGDDVITDYTSNEDYIRLYKCSITGSSVKGKNVILKTTTGNITIKNGKGKEISVLTTQVYGNSTSKLFAEDNFMTADNISEIVAEKSVGEFEFNSSEKLTQENLITFAEK